MSSWRRTYPGDTPRSMSHHPFVRDGRHKEPFSLVSVCSHVDVWHTHYPSFISHDTLYRDPTTLPDQSEQSLPKNFLPLEIRLGFLSLRWSIRFRLSCDFYLSYRTYFGILPFLQKAPTLWPSSDLLLFFLFCPQNQVNSTRLFLWCLTHPVFVIFT